MNYEDARDRMIALFDSGAASPLDTLPNGQSLLEVRIPQDAARNIWQISNSDLSAGTFEISHAKWRHTTQVAGIISDVGRAA